MLKTFSVSPIDIRMMALVRESFSILRLAGNLVMNVNFFILTGVFTRPTQVSLFTL